MDGRNNIPVQTVRDLIHSIIRFVAVRDLIHSIIRVLAVRDLIHSIIRVLAVLARTSMLTKLPYNQVHRKKLQEKCLTLTTEQLVTGKIFTPNQSLNLVSVYIVKHKELVSHLQMNVKPTSCLIISR